MFMTKKINKDVVAVVTNDPSIYLRKSGKQYYGTEEDVCSVMSSTLVIHQDVAERYGLKIIVEKGDKDAD